MEKIVLPTEEIEKLLKENYSNIVAEEITTVEKLDGNEKNSHNYIVYTKQRKYLARRHLALTKENAEIVLQIISFCSKQGIKVPTIIENSRKELVTRKNEDHFSVFEFIEGNEFTGSPQQVKAVAREVARLHQALKKYSGPLPKSDGSAYDENRYANLTENEMMLLEKDLWKELPAEDVSFIRKEMEERSRIKAMIKNEFLVQQPIHRDLHPKNVLFHGDDVAAILDFDAIKNGARILDVGFCGFRFAGKNLSSFINEYDKINSLTLEERKALLFVVREEYLRRINYILHDLLKGQKTWFFSLKSHLDAIKVLWELKSEN